MQSLVLERALADALQNSLGAEHRPAALVRACQDSKFGDYQCHTLIGLAKKLGQNPRELAQTVAGLVKKPLETVCDVEVAGAGYINFRLHASYVAGQAAAALLDPRLGVPLARTPRTVAVDFSSPNIAKTMHVGHIRSTILGDTLARILRFVGHRVITDNHLGDWGTQFGYLIVGWKKYRNGEALQRDSLAECERLYKHVYALAEAEESVRNEARAELAQLQSGNPENVAIWKQLCDISRIHFESLYGRLGVKFDHTLGESFYNRDLPGLVRDLRAVGLAQESEGAVCIFSDEKQPPEKDPFFIRKEEGWQPNPMLIQKKDGAFLYATTDLATLQYRIRNWHPDEILYVTDARQQLHFQQLFAAAQRCHFFSKTTALRHLFFGSILGEGGKPLKTREGEPPKLKELIEEAEHRALAVVQEKNPDLPDSQKQEIARVVGLGALKYADLCQNRTTDYTFSWDKMLAMNGNTAPYLQYAYVRVRSIFRKDLQPVSPTMAPLELTDPTELDLAKHLLRFSEVIYYTLDDYRPHFLCGYLYDVATQFSAFYSACPVLKATEPARASRLALCQLTAAILKQGLDLLGIETIEEM